MRDTTFPVLEEGFSHADSHEYANDDRQISLVLVGLVAAFPALVVFIAALMIYTPR
jgi:hypothetical protein